MERRAGKVRLFQLDRGFPLVLYWRKRMETGRQYADGYKNGTIYTGNGFVTDFAVENGKFCFVGETDKATADEVVDLGG